MTSIQTARHKLRHEIGEGGVGTSAKSHSGLTVRAMMDRLAVNPDNVIQEITEKFKDNCVDSEFRKLVQDALTAVRSHECTTAYGLHKIVDAFNGAIAHFLSLPTDAKALTPEAKAHSINVEMLSLLMACVGLAIKHESGFKKGVCSLFSLSNNAAPLNSLLRLPNDSIRHVPMSDVVKPAEFALYAKTMSDNFDDAANCLTRPTKEGSLTKSTFEPGGPQYSADGANKVREESTNIGTSNPYTQTLHDLNALLDGGKFEKIEFESLKNHTVADWVTLSKRYSGHKDAPQIWLEHLSKLESAQNVIAKAIELEILAPQDHLTLSLYDFILLRKEVISKVKEAIQRDNGTTIMSLATRVTKLGLTTAEIRELYETIKSRSTTLQGVQHVQLQKLFAPAYDALFYVKERLRTHKYALSSFLSSAKHYVEEYQSRIPEYSPEYEGLGNILKDCKQKLAEVEKDFDRLQCIENILRAYIGYGEEANYSSINVDLCINAIDEAFREWEEKDKKDSNNTFDMRQSALPKFWQMILPYLQDLGHFVAKKIEAEEKYSELQNAIVETCNEPTKVNDTVEATKRLEECLLTERHYNGRLAMHKKSFEHLRADIQKPENSVLTPNGWRLEFMAAKTCADFLPKHVKTILELRKQIDEVTNWVPNQQQLFSKLYDARLKTFEWLNGLLGLKVNDNVTKLNKDNSQLIIYFAKLIDIDHRLLSVFRALELVLYPHFLASTKGISGDNVAEEAVCNDKTLRDAVNGLLLLQLLTSEPVLTAMNAEKSIFEKMIAALFAAFITSADQKVPHKRINIFSALDGLRLNVVDMRYIRGGGINGTGPYRVPNKKDALYMDHNTAKTFYNKLCENFVAASAFMLTTPPKEDVRWGDVDLLHRLANLIELYSKCITFKIDGTYSLDAVAANTFADNLKTTEASYGFFNIGMYDDVMGKLTQEASLRIVLALGAIGRKFSKAHEMDPAELGGLNTAHLKRAFADRNKSTLPTEGDNFFEVASTMYGLKLAEQNAGKVLEVQTK